MNNAPKDHNIDSSQCAASSHNNSATNNNNNFNVKHNPCLLLDSLNTCHMAATQNIAGGLQHLHKQLAIFSLLDNPPPSTTRIDVMGYAHTGLSHKQAKHIWRGLEFQRMSARRL